MDNKKKLTMLSYVAAIVLGIALVNIFSSNRMLTIPTAMEVTIINTENVYLSVFNQPTFSTEDGKYVAGQRLQQYYENGLPILIVNSEYKAHVIDMKFKYLGKNEKGQFCFEVIRNHEQNTKYQE